MNCFHEMVAAAWMFAMSKFNPSLSMTELATAEESLFVCKNNLGLKLRELEDISKGLATEILYYKQRNDIGALRLKLQERRRYMTRIDKIKNSLSIVDKQIDTLQSNELDKVLLDSLKVSNNVMKKSGMKINVTEVETVMNELDEHVHESSELGQMFGLPLQSNEMFSIDEVDELEADLAQDLLDIQQESAVVPVPEAATLQRAMTQAPASPVSLLVAS